MHLDCSEASNPAKRVPKLSHHLLSVFVAIEKWCIDKCTDVNTVLQFECNGSLLALNMFSSFCKIWTTSLCWTTLGLQVWGPGEIVKFHRKWDTCEGGCLQEPSGCHRMMQCAVFLKATSF